jgi:hypothetical protein
VKDGRKKVVVNEIKRDSQDLRRYQGAVVAGAHIAVIRQMGVAEIK